ncbi:hypothetical protein Dacet_1275 [Denitrovibrio acetiphilus DSM 12809]|uniref:Uncharacterized protein n=1 Tax=Denitrovibrio acetiphilus (strain DSM 12809 / NBRC 114555 / N2460) TaxID=522772 RepID=D4H7P8_DENA2|nr:hypothetical protein Dacet_1275 [Denitrovibrio acetiphilus DSM 12809]
MVSNMIVFALIAWAAAYSTYKLSVFVKDAGKDKPVKCSCSSCPYVGTK